MIAFEVDWTAEVTEIGTQIVNGEDMDEAEQVVIDWIKATYPEYYNIEIEAIREIK